MKKVNKFEIDEIAGNGFSWPNLSQQWALTLCYSSEKTNWSAILSIGTLCAYTAFPLSWYSRWRRVGGWHAALHLMVNMSVRRAPRLRKLCLATRMTILSRPFLLALKMPCCLLLSVGAGPCHDYSKSRMKRARSHLDPCISSPRPCSFGNPYSSNWLFFCHRRCTLSAVLAKLRRYFVSFVRFMASHSIVLSQG